MTVYPEKRLTSLVAEVYQTASEACVRFPCRNEVVVGVCLDHGMKWKAVAWCVAADDPRHKLAELGHALLAAGVPIRIADPEVRRMAIEGDFTPSAVRWVSVFTQPLAYAGWFAIRWNRRIGGDWWKEAKSLPAARYVKPFVAVPPDAWREVEDFAQRHGFKLNDRARALAEKMRAMEAESVVVQVKVRERVTEDVSKGRPKLTVADAQTEIPSDLVDEP